MIDDNYYTRPTRRTKVVSAQIMHVNSKDSLFPDKKILDKVLPTLSAGSDVWVVTLDLKTGLDYEDIAIQYFDNEVDAQQFCDQMLAADNLNFSANISETLMDIYKRNGTFGNRLGTRAEYPSFRVFDILRKSGLTQDSGIGVSQKVQDWIGVDQVDFLKETFGEEWKVVAIMEYCRANFPDTSIAYMAAQCEFNYYITQDDFSVGYFYRELLLIEGGAEEYAKARLSTAEKAGKAGAANSAKLKRSRLSAFMNALENLGDSYPKFKESIIVDQAFEDASKNHPNFWKLGKGQADKYAIELRSNEPYKSRYYAIFGKSA